MFKWLGSLTDSNEKQIQRLKPLVESINDNTDEFSKLTDDELKAKTTEFRDYLTESTSEEREALKRGQAELEEAKSRASTTDEIEREEANKQIKLTEENIKRLEKALAGAENEALQELLPEGFAAVREAAGRAIGQRHFDVQMMGGIVLHQGKIAEMKTGEGKTLAATLPLYLNALTGKGVHLVTVNDYLTKFGAQWMGPVYHALGLTVSAIHSQTADNQAPSFVFDPAFESNDKAFRHLRPVSRREAYLADITYGTNNEFGFDYLRDNMVLDLKQCVQRPPNYAIVDEVDNLLIDEARTPLIISGPPPKDDPHNTMDALYKDVSAVVVRMKKKVLPHEPVTAEEKEDEEKLEQEFDYIAYEKTHNVRDTHLGQETIARHFRLGVEDLFGGWADGISHDEAKRRNDIVSVFRQSLMAHAWYEKDRNYIIATDPDGRPGIVIVDEFTGRLMHGRRYSEGLHQAIEAKEHLDVRRETLTYATVTFQNYFRMYAKLAGMTGTALTEAEEFHKIYKLEVLPIPTNRPMVRQDFSDRIYKDEKSKFGAVVKEVIELNKARRPVLIGTVSIEVSERLSDLLLRQGGIKTQVLNARPERAQQEAEIIREAGRPGKVTVATNMAGRGVDIILGGNPDAPGRNQQEWQKEHDEVIALGGLHIIGTERHEARRIDNQLRGRAGRQGDPGSSRFFVSLDDDIMKRFGGDRIRGLMEMAGMNEDTPIENRLVNKAIENAQIRVEGFHFDIRKNLVEFDDVVNQHRELVYSERRKILGGANLKANIINMVKEEIHNDILEHQGNQPLEGWDIQGALAEANTMFPLSPEFVPARLESMQPKHVEDLLVEHAVSIYEQKEKEYGPQNMRMLERLVMLRAVDTLWVEHLTLMDDKRKEAGWASLKQIKAIDAYKNLGAEQWALLTSSIGREVAHMVYHVAIVQEPPPPSPHQAPRQTQKQLPKQPPPAPSPMAQAIGPRNNTAVASAAKKVGRNDPCPCGSGKKYKHCHGQ
jgi:preprotein translocase subunit SecA